MKNRVIALTAAVSLLFGTAPFGAPVSAAAGTGTLTVTVYDGETGELFTAEDLVFWATGNAADGQSGGGEVFLDSWKTSESNPHTYTDIENTGADWTYSLQFAPVYHENGEYSYQIDRERSETTVSFADGLSQTADVYMTKFFWKTDEMLMRTYTLMRQFAADHPGTVLEDINPNWFGVSLCYPAEKENEILSDLRAVLRENGIPEEMVAYAPLYSSAEFKEGDVDQNGKVEIADAIMLARWLAEDADITVTAEGLAAADLTDDGLVTADDQAKLLCRLAGVRDEKPQPSEGRSVDLLKDIQAGEAAVLDPAAEDFCAAQAAFSAGLLRTLSAQEPDDSRNLLISPVSVSLALAMTMNGAKGQTLSEMQKVLGAGLTAEQLNQYYAGWQKVLTEPGTVSVFERDEHGNYGQVEKESLPVTIANALWLKDSMDQLHVPDAFLQTTADYYKAGAFKAPFDQTTVEDINTWADENTKHMIPQLVDTLDPECIMVLANALTFECEWGKTYLDDQVQDGVFRAANGEDRAVKMMHGLEYVYLHDDQADGFLKYYKDTRYSFAAILPHEDVPLDAYIAGLTGDRIRALTASRHQAECITAMPKFTFDYDSELNNALKALGMELPFDKDAADFTGLNDAAGIQSWLGSVIHKTHIEVNESGTKAAAVTAAMIGGAGGMSEMHEIILDRPFLFMILDNQTDLPIFIGTVKDIQ